MQEKNKKLSLLKEIFPSLWEKEEKIRSLFLLSLGLIIASISFDLSIPIVLKEVVSSLSIPEKSMTFQLSLLLVAYGVIWMLSQIVQNLRQIIMVRPLERCIRLFCSQLFNHLHSLPMQFHLDRKTGSVTNALERAQRGFPDIFWGLFLFVIPTLIELCLAATILCYYYGIIYSFILLCIATAFIIFTHYATEWSSHFQILSNDQQSNTNANIVDSLLNFASVKHFNNKKYEVSKCDEYLKEREKILIKSMSSMEYVRIGQSLIIGIGLILLTYTAGQQTLLSVYDVSDFVLINGYILQFAAPLGHMGFIVRDIRRGMNEMASIVEILKIEPEISASSEKISPLKSLKSIEFQNVFFGYEPERAILKDINFYLEKGKTLGIVGTTGSGKSTISNLLFKFYNTNSGRILFNNKDIDTFNTEQLSYLIGIVPQDITLFNTTIYENILFARPNARRKEVEEVISLTHLDSVLKRFPHYYDTVVGERGLKLSGGEKQRIAIARILLKRPALYIFDEATSSLDFGTEEAIMKNIAPILKKSSAIIIAHRLPTIVNVDEILVFHHGMVEERGAHSSLLKKQGLYASLWKTYKEDQKKSYAA